MGLFIICTSPLQTRVCKWREVEAEHGMGVLEVSFTGVQNGKPGVEPEPSDYRSLCCSVSHCSRPSFCLPVTW